MTRRAWWAVGATTAFLAGCAAGPDYRTPALDLPVAWKVEAPWREGRPDDLAAKGPWWRRFDDPQLDVLAEQAVAANATLAVAAARLAQARAIVSASSAALLPQLNLTTRASRQRISANRSKCSTASARRTGSC